jgi:ABC-type uncharacterized transport system involved in gliding motility auxiliary subunit
LGVDDGVDTDVGSQPLRTFITKVLGVSQEAAVLLAAFGAIGLVGGGAIGIWIAELRPFAAGTAAIGVILMGAATIGSLPRLKFVFSPSRRSAVNYVAISTTIVIAIALLLNVLASDSAAKWDTSASKQFTLAPQTEEVLRDLPARIQILGFFALSEHTSQTSHADSRRLLSEFERHAHGKLTFELIDAEANPSRARALGLNDFPTLVFQSEGVESAFSVPGDNVTEQMLVTSLLVATRQQQKMVYYLTGHGERDFQNHSIASDGFGLVGAGIVFDGYRIRPLNLAQSGAVPEDAAVLVIAAPRGELLEPEEKILTNWLADGGRALLLLEPGAPASFVRLLVPWGVDLLPGVIFDYGSSITGDPQTPLLQRNDYVSVTSDNDATRIVESLDVTFFPDATALGLTSEAIVGTADGDWPVSYTWLAQTSPVSVLVGNDAQLPGPHSIVVAMQGTKPGAKRSEKRTSIVVFADSDFATNRFYNAYANADLLLNSINWLAEDFALASIRPNAGSFRHLVMTRQEFNFVRFSSWFVLPAAMIALAIVAWWRRR